MADPAEAQPWSSGVAGREGRARKLALVPPQPSGAPAGIARWAVDGATLKLLAEVRGADPGLARLLQRVLDNETPFVVVSPLAVSGWRERVPDAWGRVEGWLRARRIAIIEV